MTSNVWGEPFEGSDLHSDRLGVRIDIWLGGRNPHGPDAVHCCNPLVDRFGERLLEVVPSSSGELHDLMADMVIVPRSGWVVGFRRNHFKFAHGARHVLPDGRALFDSYHCSRYNTNTGRLTPPMFRSVFDAIADHLGRGRP